MLKYLFIDMINKRYRWQSEVNSIDVSGDSARVGQMHQINNLFVR